MKFTQEDVVLTLYGPVALAHLVKTNDGYCIYFQKVSPNGTSVKCDIYTKYVWQGHAWFYTTIRYKGDDEKFTSESSPYFADDVLLERHLAESIVTDLKEVVGLENFDLDSLEETEQNGG